MKKKFLNTKNVVIGLVSLVLIGASATGVAVFLKDRGEAAAAEQEQVQNLPATGRGEDNNQTGENTTIPSENNTTGDNTQIPTEPSTTEGATPGETTRPGTTGTTTRSRTEEAVAGIEETVRIEERKVFEDLKLSWTTLAIPAITADMGIFKPVLGIEKTATAVVRANQEEQIPVTENNKPMVRAGDTIIYTIKVSNSGNYKATNVVVTDSLDVIFDGKIVPANKELVKIETLDAGKQATLKVGYVVKQEDINAVLETEQNETISKDIINIATATDGKTTVEDEDKTVPVNPDVTISGTKTWVDNNNAYQTRPESIVVNLIAGNDIVAEQEVRPDAEGNWTYTFTNLPKYDDNKNEIIYQVSENELDNYTYQVSEKGYDIKNTIKQDSTVKVEGTKIWIAPAGTEFPEVTIKLLRDGKEYKTTKVTANNTYSFTGLDKYDLTDGHVYSYTVEEVVPTGYTSKQEGNNFVNTIAQDSTVKVEGTKTWIAPAGTEFPEVTIKLLRDGKEYKTTKVTANNTYSFTGLDKYDLTDGHVYSYTVEEVVPTGYTSKQEGNNFVNTIAQDSTVKVEGTKTWIAPAGTEFPEVTIKLLRDGKEYKTTKVTANNTYSFTGLDKYDLTDGHVYSYTVEEVVPTGYTSKQEGNNFVNTIAQDSTVKVEGTKTWIAPAGTEFPEVTIKLLRDGKEYKTTKVTANNTYSFTGLDKYDLTDGHVYSYTVEEVVPTGYTSKQEGNNFVNTIKQEYVSLSGSKIWIDPEGKKHDTITLQVYQNNEPYKVNGVDYSIELADGTTTFSFTGLPKYKVDSEGNYVLVNGKVQLNEYKVVETTGQTGYSVSYSRVTPDNYGNYTQNVTNSLEQTQISFTANKVWVDEGIVANRKNITVELYKNNVATGITKTINKGQTSCTFENLERYTIVEENGKIKSITENKYSVQEKTISGYDEPTYSEVTKNGAEWSQTITNTKTQEKINIEGTKTWNCVPDGETKPTVIVELFRDYKDGDQAIDRTEVVNGKYSFTDLDKFDMENNYREYQYTVKEIVPDGYIATYDGHNITNTKQITATKTAETSTGVKEVNIGETIEYKIIITNNTEVATEVTVQDNIPGLNQGNVKVEVNGDITLEGKPLTEVEVQALYNGTFKVNMPATATRTIVIPIKVTAGMTGDKIKNTAYVNAEPTNEVINPIERTVAVTRYKNNLSSTNIILVLDVSSSMKGDKIKTAKQAVIDFIEKTYKTEENKDVTFTLITFAKREYTEGARGDQQGEKYKYHGGLFEFNDSGENKGKYEYGCGNSIITLQNHEDFKTAFEGLLTDRGTNMRAGLEVAYNRIYGEAENTLSKLYPNYDKIVIFFGDGEPYGEENEYNNERGIKEAAGWLKAKKAKVYSIGFGNGASEGTKGYKRLRDISSDGKVYTSSNYTQLIKNFSDIISADPVVYPYTIDGNAIIELTAESTQKIVVDEKNPIKIKIGDAEEILITDIATAEKYKITYTNKKIIWDVKEYSKDTNLRISYHVQ